ARMTLSGQVDAGFFLASAYHALARITRERLKVLVESKLRDISHVLLAHPRVGGDLQPLAQALLAVDPDDAGDAQVLQALGLPRGSEPMELEDAEFVIGLIDTLLDCHGPLAEHTPRLPPAYLCRGPCAAGSGSAPGAAAGGAAAGRYRTGAGRAGRPVRGPATGRHRPAPGRAAPGLRPADAVRGRGLRPPRARPFPAGAHRPSD